MPCRFRRTVPIAPIAFGPVAASGVRRALADLRPDVVHLHEPLIPSLSLLALLNSHRAVRGNVSCVLRVERRLTGLHDPILKRVIDRLRVRIVVSDAARDLIGRYFPGDYEVIPNGVEVARYADGSSGGSWRRANDVLFLGRIERRKGLEVLIQALTRLRDLDAELVVVGTGPEERACSLAAEARGRCAVHRWRSRRSQGRDLPVGRRVLRPGARRGVVRDRADRGDGGGNARRVLGPAGLPGRRRGQAAALVPPGDPGRLADAQRGADRREPGRFNERNGQDRSAARYDWPRLAERLEDVYVRAVAGSGAMMRSMEEHHRGQAMPDWGQDRVRVPGFGRGSGGSLRFSGSFRSCSSSSCSPASHLWRWPH